MLPHLQKTKLVISYHLIALKVSRINIEIEKIQTLYKKYEDIINDIYLAEDGKLQINQKDINLNYVKFNKLAILFGKRLDTR